MLVTLGLSLVMSESCGFFVVVLIVAGRVEEGAVAGSQFVASLPEFARP